MRGSLRLSFKSGLGVADNSFVVGDMTMPVIPGMLVALKNQYTCFRLWM